MTVKKGIDHKSVIKILIIVATVAAGCTKIMCGWDQDESYIMLLVYRLLKGDILFGDIWDLHQTCAVLQAVLVTGFYKAFGVTGMALFLRVITQVILVLVAVFLYFIINRSYGSDAAFFSAFIVLNLLPRATLQMEYGLSTVIFAIVSSALILDVWKHGEEGAALKMTIAGLFYGLSVFVYPTMIITVPLFFYVCFFRLGEDPKKRIKNALFFWGACMVLACIFLGYILYYISLSDLLSVLGELGKSADHPTMFSAFQNPAMIIKSGLRMLAYFVVTIGIWFLFRKKLLRLSQIYYIFLIISFISVVIPNITGLRPSGPFGLLERYIVIAVLSVFLSMKIDDKPLFWTFLAAGILYYFGSLMGSNLGFGENAMFLEMTIIAGAIYGSMAMDSYEEEMMKNFAFISLAILILEITFSKGYFIRVNGTVPANITWCSTTLDEGPFYGIKVSGSQKSEYDRHIDIIEKNTDEGHLYMYLGNDPVYNFFFNGEVTSAQYAGTAKPNVQYVDYYSVFGHKLPDHIYLDKSIYRDLEEFLDSEFGSYLKEKRYIREVTEMEDFYVFALADGNDQLKTVNE